MSDFETFWGLQIRKVKKRAALKSWDKAIKEGVAPEEIIEGWNRQLPDMRARELKYVPHPITWLNGWEWENEPENQPTKPQYRAFESWSESEKDECRQIIEKFGYEKAIQAFQYTRRQIDQLFNRPNLKVVEK